MEETSDDSICENEIDNCENYDKYEEMELKMQQDTLPWIEKYRPNTLDNILSHEEIISTLRIFIQNKCLPHLLFYGPPGTGKTSTIMAVAKELYGKYFDFMVMELNASDDRGIDVVRSKIKQFVMSQSVFFKNSEKKNIFKLVILDETDAMTSDAQAILRKIVEEYTNNTRFCLICNYINNISLALQSRCTRFRFSPITNDNIKLKIMEVIKKEKIRITDVGINTIIKRSNGDMRRALNILQSAQMIYPVITEKNINTYVGYPRKNIMDDIFNSLINDDFKQCYDTINRIRNENGLSLSDMITEIHNVLTRYIITSKTHHSSIKTINASDTLKILSNLREIEFNISANVIENIQMGGLIGIFKNIV